VVDDDRAYRRLVALQLRSVGWTCLTASTHAEAIEKLADHPEIDIVLLDYNVHGNGPQALVREINKLERRPYIVGHSSTNRRRDFAALGVRRFVSKPLPLGQYSTLASEFVAAPSGEDA
jgi:CheY-like chemotaxis protein